MNGLAVCLCLVSVDLLVGPVCVVLVKIDCEQDTVLLFVVGVTRPFKIKSVGG